MGSPTQHPSNLSVEHQRFYRKLVGTPGRHDLHKTKDAAQVTMAHELADLGLAHVRDLYGNNEKVNVQAVDVHPLYNHFESSGALHIKMYVAAPHDVDPRAETLLVVMNGAEIMADSSGHGGTIHRVSCYHPDATDIEHDASRYAKFLLRNIKPVSIGVTSEYVGTIVESRMWMWGQDPTSTDDPYVPKGRCEVCDTPHPFAPYLPPENPDLSTLVGYTAVLHVTPKELA